VKRPPIGPKIPCLMLCSSPTCGNCALAFRAREVPFLLRGGRRTGCDATVENEKREETRNKVATW
jgi:hypothetical protein